jgi:hypothetical protein
MRKHLNDFRDEFLDRILDITWNQWTTLGVLGRGKSWAGSVIDPEALLIFSSSVARYDARLFDAILEWLRINGRFINVARINRIMRNEKFVGKSVLQSMVAATTTSEHESKWKRLTHGATQKKLEPEMLFYHKDGNPLPVIREKDSLFNKYGFLRDSFQERGVAQTFRPEQTGNLLLRLRAFFGVNARCEILLYLLLNNWGSPRAMARESYYISATISKALAEMEQSGLLLSRNEGRYRFFEFSTADDWKSIFLEKGSSLSWIVWARLFSALEQVWLFLNNNRITDKSTLEQASTLRRLLRDSVITQLGNSGMPFIFGNDSTYLGEDLIPFFISRTRTILNCL